MFLTNLNQVKKSLKDKKQFAIRYLAHTGEMVILTCSPVLDGRRYLWQAIFNGKPNRNLLSSKDMARVASDCVISLPQL